MYISLILSLFLNLSCAIGPIATTAPAAHDIHISKTEVHYKSDLGMLQLSVHIYVDDLELHLEDQGYTALKLNTHKEHEDGDLAVAAYLKKHLVFKSAGQVLPQTVIGKEASEDLAAVWCYVEIPLTSLAGLSVENTILLDIHKDQSNLISFKVDGERRAFLKLDADKPQTSLE